MFPRTEGDGLRPHRERHKQKYQRRMNFMPRPLSDFNAVSRSLKLGRTCAGVF